jgi:predicted nuclease with RNAse H fold
MGDVVGIDLAGSPRRNTGFCIMDPRMRCTTAVLHEDEDILTRTIAASPDVVSIDAPLFLPRGRRSLDVRGPPHLRECDRELLRMRIRFFPVSLGPMRMLAARGMRLRAELEKKGLTVIESFPGAIQDILGIPRKQAGLLLLEKGLHDHGVSWRASGLSGDELDAVTSALVGLMYLRNDFTAIGDPEEGLMILPKPRT